MDAQAPPSTYTRELPAPAGLAQPHAEPAGDAPAQEWTTPRHVLAWSLAGALVLAGGGAAVAMMEAHGSIDRAAPDTASTALGLLLASVPMLLGFTLVAVNLRRMAQVPVLVGVGAGLVLALFVHGAFRDYGQWLAGLGLAAFFAYGGGALVVALIVLGIICAIQPRPGITQTALGLALAWVAAWGLAALMLLVNLDNEARAAAEANRPTASAPLVVGLGACLLGAAAWARSRRMA